MKIRCKDCEKVEILEKEEDLSEDEEYVSQFLKWDHLEFLHSQLEMMDSYTIYYCPKCHSVFQSYEIHEPEDGDEQIYGSYCFTHNKEIKYAQYYLKFVGEYWRKKERLKELEELKKENGEITLYLMAHVDELQKLKKGNILSCQNLSKRCERTFAELVGPYAHTRWVVNCRYYIKVNVPKRTLEIKEEFEQGIRITSHALLKKEEIEVLDPYYGTFIPFENWDVPPIYEQTSKKVDDYFFLYKPVVELHQKEYEEKIEEEQKKETQWLKKIYPECFK